ncbi:MAG: hypothetical protein V4608_15980 [Bacteroidota bacterium]
MKKLITPLFFLLFSTVVVAQTITDDYFIGKPKLLSKDRVSASIAAGTAFSFSKSPQNSYYTTFIAPKIGYQLTPKFKLNIGLMHYTVSGNSFMQTNSNESILNTNSKPFTGNLVFVEGVYQLKPKLAMSGMIMSDVSNLHGRENNFKAASLGLQYKVSEHSSIGIKATVTNGNANDPYFNQGTLRNSGFSNNMSPMNTFPSFGQ